MGKGLGEKPSVLTLGLESWSGPEFCSSCCREDESSSVALGDSVRESPVDLGVTGLLRISVADMR